MMKQTDTRLEIHYGDRLVRCFSERPSSVRGFFEAAMAGAPDAPAVCDGDRTLSYRDLDLASSRAAGWLAASGVGRGDRVAIIADNSAEFVIVALACAKLAAILVPMGIRLRAPEITHICRDSGAGILFHDASLAGALPEAADMPEVRVRVSIAGGAPGSAAFGDVLAAAPLAALPDLHEDDAFCIFYTSGTTGKPKGAIITHLGIVHSCLHWEAQLDLPKGLAAVLAIPASHIAGFAGVVMPTLYLRGRLTMMRNFKAAALLDLIAASRIEHALLVPAMYNLCLTVPDIEARDLTSWQWAVYGGAPMGEATIARFRALLPSLRMANAYGATETTSPATIMLPERTADKLASIGRSVPCGDIRIIGEDGREALPGMPGELFISGPMVTPGYWNNPEATEKSFVTGYWRSGDIGAIDDEGFVSIFDRKKDMIIRAGYKVFPAEVENVIAHHDDVLDVAVVGVPDPVLGERVAAFVQRRGETLSAEEIRAFCTRRMADYKVPERFEVSNEALPRNANGKLQKDVLRRLL